MLDKLVAVCVAHLVAVAVPLVNQLRSVSLIGARSGRNLARVSSQAHGATLVLNVFLLGHKVNDERNGRPIRGKRAFIGEFS